MTGLQRICKRFGRMKCGGVMMVWDYANDIAVPESEMKMGSERWKRSEVAKFISIAPTPVPNKLHRPKP